MTLDITKLDPRQVEAIDAGLDLKNRIVAVTGAAGTGKTSIMKFLYEQLVAVGHNVVLCAPTGKAAKRIQEATGHPAMTIHRLLEYSKPGDVDPVTGKALIPGMPKRGINYPIEQNIVLGDEYAMVNHEVHRNLFDALPRGACVRVFGDKNRLPPIEPTHLLAQQPSPFTMLMSRHKCIVLEKIHRQGEGSGIVAAGSRVIKGWAPLRASDFEMVVTQHPVDKLKEIIARDKTLGIVYDGHENQILTATNVSWIGTRALNTMLLGQFHPDMSERAIELPRHE